MQTALKNAVWLILAATVAAAQPNPWTDKPFLETPGAFQFAVVADRCGGHREGVFEAALAKANLLRPRFVMSVGDFIEGYEHDAATLDREWDEVTAAVNQALDMRFFYVPGNHDIHAGDAGGLASQERWLARFGRTYYHFVYEQVLFLCLCTEDPPPTSLSEAQIAYFKEALEQNRDVRWTCVFLHKPLWAEADAKGWDALEALLQDRPYTVFAGHWHNYVKYERNGRAYYVLATSGGSSQLRGEAVGEFDQLAWVTMTEGGPRVANLLLDGIRDDRVCTEQSTRYAEALAAGGFVTQEPLTIGSEMFNGGTARLRFKNPLDASVRATVTIAPEFIQWPEPGRIELTLEPRAEITADVALQLYQPMPSAMLRPLPVRWTAEVLPADALQPAVSVDGRLALQVAAPMTSAERGTPVEFDGNLSEWQWLYWQCYVPGAVTGNHELWTGPEDGSFRFSVEHDDANLYIGIEARDDRLTLVPGRESWKQDGLRVFIDGRNIFTVQSAPGGKEFEEFLLVALSPGEGQTLYRAADLPEGARAVCVTTPDGYNMEIAIPEAYLDEKAGIPWQTARVNICMTDVDGDPLDPRTYLWWQPDWNGPGDNPQSGVFWHVKPTVTAPGEEGEVPALP